MFSPPKRKKGPRANKQVFAGKVRLRKGDLVRVIAGKDRNKEGTIARVLPSEGKVIIEGINIVVKHQKARPQANMNAAAAQAQGGRIEIAAPISVSKVMLVDKGAKKAVTRIGIKELESGERVRYAKKSGGVIE